MRWAGPWWAWYQLSLSLARTRLALSWNLYKPGPRRTQVYPLTSTSSASSTPHSCWDWEDILISGDLPDFPWSLSRLSSRVSSQSTMAEARPHLWWPLFLQSTPEALLRLLRCQNLVQQYLSLTLNPTSLAILSINPSLVLIGYHVTRLGLQAPTEIRCYLSLGVGVDSLNRMWELELADIHTRS